MARQLTFSEEYQYVDDPDGITIPLVLSYGEKSARLLAKVDTGAEVCLFSHEDGRTLGLPIEQGLPITLRSLGGPLEAFGHEVTIQTGDLTFQSVIYFAKYPGLPRNFLGRRGWLRNLRLAIIDYDNLLYLSAYDK
jgi:hypothetical protein